MQRVYAYLDTGGGLRPVTSVSDAPAMLSGFTIQWGVDSPDTQPDPSVCDFTLVDRDGRLAGNFIDLAGARIVIRINDSPTWEQLGPQFGTFDDCAVPWYQLAGRWDPQLGYGARTTTIFDGIISTGGSISKHDDSWLIGLSATSRMVLWKRLQSQGPLSADGSYHWAGRPVDRVNVMNQRAAAINAPQVDVTGLDYPDSVAPYDTDTYPSQLDLLHRMFAHSAKYPLWHEDVSGDVTSIGHTDLAVSVGLVLDAQAIPYTSADGALRMSIPASSVETDADMSLRIMEPWTQAQVNGKKAETKDGKTSFTDSQITYTDSSLPLQVRNLQKTISLDSDSILASDNQAYPAWTPTVTDRTMMSGMLTTLDTCAVPETVTFDSRRIDPYQVPYVFRTQPSGPIYILGQASDHLTHDDGTPTSSVVWTTIGGTLTYEWVNGEPVMRNECSLCPIPFTPGTSATWNDLSGWPAVYSMVSLTWAQFGLVQEFMTTNLQEE